MPRAPSVILVTLAITVGVFFGAPVRANGRFPQAQQVVVGPGASDDIVVLRATFSLAVSDNGGRRFNFLCEDSFGYIDGYDPPIAIAGDGSLLVALTDGLAATRDWCSPRRRKDLEGLRVTDLATTPAGTTVFATVVSNDDPPSSRVARSRDNGVTWELSEVPLEGVELDTIDPAPSDSMRVYAAGRDARSGVPILARSDDGGVVWHLVTIDATQWGQWFVSGVHPVNPEVLWLRARPSGVSDAGENGDVLLQSDDGGHSTRVVFRSHGSMRGFAVDSTGNRVWAGGPDDGLWSSEGGRDFAQVDGRGVECLRWHSGTLWLCRAFAPCAAMLSRWDDGSPAPQDVVGFDQLEGPPMHCGPGSVTHELCPARYSAVRAVIAPTVCGGDGGTDAGLTGRDSAITGDTGELRPAGCQCRAGADVRLRRDGSDLGRWAIVLCTVGFLCGRRRALRDRGNGE